LSCKFPYRAGWERKEDSKINFDREKEGKNKNLSYREATQHIKAFFFFSLGDRHKLKKPPSTKILMSLLFNFLYLISKETQHCNKVSQLTHQPG
jgi:hypothetical protein